MEFFQDTVQFVETNFWLYFNPKLRLLLSIIFCLKKKKKKSSYPFQDIGLDKGFVFDILF